VDGGDLVTLLECQARSTPDSIALVFEGTPVSYARLHAMTNRLARLLIEHGARPDRIVALVVPRSVELVVGSLAVRTRRDDPAATAGRDRPVLAARLTSQIHVPPQHFGETR